METKYEKLCRDRKEAEKRLAKTIEEGQKLLNKIAQAMKEGKELD